MTVMNISRGQRIKLTDIISSGNEFQLGIACGSPPGLVVDFSCFGLDASEKLSDDRYIEVPIVIRTWPPTTFRLFVQKQIVIDLVCPALYWDHDTCPIRFLQLIGQFVLASVRKHYHHSVQQQAQDDQ